MPFDYYNRLPRSQQRVYNQSNGITTINLSHPEKYHTLVTDLEKALAGENRSLTEKAAQRMTTTLVESFKIRPLKIKVLERRPSNSAGELQGLYEPAEKGQADQITLWMRTAKRKQVVAFKTFLRTLLHELCHHLDYELLELKETFHTEGFFKRESSLFHQLYQKNRND